jgi:hypothetical protein
MNVLKGRRKNYGLKKGKSVPQFFISTIAKCFKIHFLSRLMMRIFAHASGWRGGKKCCEK